MAVGNGFIEKTGLFVRIEGWIAVSMKLASLDRTEKAADG
jgi:hypothetical protein